MAGITLTYSPKKPVGRRVIKIFINDQPINMRQHYIITTNDFLAEGGDGYTVFRDTIKRSKGFAFVYDVMKSDIIVYSDSGRWIRDIVTAYISKHKIIGDDENY